MTNVSVHYAKHLHERVHEEGWHASCICMVGEITLHLNFMPLRARKLPLGLLHRPNLKITSAELCVVFVCFAAD
jgi:hypothetical protein